MTLILHSVEAADHFIKVGDEGRGRKVDEKTRAGHFEDLEKYPEGDDTSKYHMKLVDVSSPDTVCMFAG